MKSIMQFLSLLVCFAGITTAAHAQKFKTEKGDFKVLSGQSEVNVVYDYSKMSVGKFKTEEEYVNKKKTEYNAKEAGRGDNWEKGWISEREERYQPKFEELFNKNSKGAKVGNYPNAKYTMKVLTTFTEPGFNIHVTRKNASINGEIQIYETANPQQVIAIYKFTNAPGRSFGGHDYDTGFRIQEAYSALGKALGKRMSK